MTDKLPEWPDEPTGFDAECMRFEASTVAEAYERSRAEAAIARLRFAAALLDELAEGDDWIKSAVARFHAQIGPLPLPPPTTANERKGE